MITKQVSKYSIQNKFMKKMSRRSFIFSWFRYFRDEFFGKPSVIAKSERAYLGHANSKRRKQKYRKKTNEGNYTAIKQECETQ